MCSAFLENGMEFAIDIDDYDYYASSFKLYLNDILIYSIREYVFPRSITFYTLGDYFIFNRNLYDEGDDELIIFDANGNMIRHFYEMDETTYGLTIKSFTVSEEGILLTASRLTEDTIVIGDEYYDFCEIKKSDVEEELIVKAEYFYKYENGTFELEKNSAFPEEWINVLETLEDVLERQKSVCQ